MTRKTVPAAAILALSILPAASALAQWDPGMVAQGQVLRSMNQGYADRAAGKVAPRREQLSPQSIAYCKAKWKARNRLGGNDPRVRRLYALCAQAGM